MNHHIHYRYTIGILVGLMIILLTIKWTELESVANYISFAATVASLLLAVVAIIYSFLSNNSFSSSVSKIEIAADTVRAETEKLNDTIKSFDDVIRQIPDSIKNVESRLHETNEAIKASSQSTGASAPEKDWSPKNIQYFIDSSSWYGLKSMLICKMSYTGKRTFNLFNVCESAKTLSFDYAYGYIVAATSAGILKHGAEGHVLEVTYFSEGFSSLVEKRIKEVCDEAVISTKENLETEILQLRHAFLTFSHTALDAKDPSPSEPVN
jgi:hypothetical protein